jgi:hypothetical protein
MTADNVYYKHWPKTYIPYAPNEPLKPYSHAAADDTMLPLAIAGLCVTVVLGLPVGVFTGPAALKRASRLEQLVNTGERPASDRGNITGARVCAWISIGLSIPLLLMWLSVIGLFALALAG